LTQAFNSKTVAEFIRFLVQGEVEKYCAEKLENRG